MLPKFECRLASTLRANVRLRNLLHGMKPTPMLLLRLFSGTNLGQAQPLSKVPAGLLVDAYAYGRERLEHGSHSRLLADTARSIVESQQSPHGTPVMRSGAEIRPAGAQPQRSRERTCCSLSLATDYIFVAVRSKIGT